MSGPTPRLHAPDKDGNSLCGREASTSNIRIAKTAEVFRTIPEIEGHYASGSVIFDDRWMGTGAKCKVCAKLQAKQL